MRLPPNSTPIWATAPTTRASSFPPLAGDRRTDVVVVGAGIAGLTTAVELIRAGGEVVVLEAGSVGAGTSGHSTAKASALQGTRYRVITELHGRSAAQRYARAQLDGLAWMASHAAPVGAARWEERRAVTYATTDAGRREVEEEADAASDAGLGLSSAPLDLPFATTASVTLDGQAQLDPAPYLRALAAEVAASPNGTLHERSRVTAVRGRRDLEVVTADGTVRCARVVVATLLPVINRGWFFARAAPTSSYLVALEVRGQVPRSMSLGVDAPTRSLRTATVDGREVLLVGGNGHRTGRGGPTLPRYRQLVDWASTHFEVTDVLARWSAHDYAPVDHLPFVGAVSPFSPRVFVATGFEKWGMTMGTAAGMALAQRITGLPGPATEWADLFEPRRCTPRAAPTAVRLNAQVGVRLASDWMRPDAQAPDGSAVRGRAGLVPTGQAEGAARLRVVCTHLGGICSWNDGDRTWDCPLHGSRFEVDGAVRTAPATEPLTRLPPSDQGN